MIESKYMSNNNNQFCQKYYVLNNRRTKNTKSVILVFVSDVINIFTISYF